MTNARLTVFLDRDGTINVNFPMPNVNTPERLFLLEGAAEGIRILNDLGARVIIVTNQAGIENPENDLNEETMGRITARLDEMLRAETGAVVEDTFVCPHLERSACDCRKPATGLIRQALSKYPEISLQHAFIVGDRTDDILLGRAMGIRSILVLTGHGEDTARRLQEMNAQADATAANLLEAARMIRTLTSKS